jgi:hypothetical protein
MAKAKESDWLRNMISSKYGKDSTTKKPASGTMRPPKASNQHQPTIDLINKILFTKGIPDNIRVDTLRVLAMLLENNKGDRYVEHEFKKFLYRDNPDAKKIKQKQKATGGWITK